MFKNLIFYIDFPDTFDVTQIADGIDIQVVKESGHKESSNTNREYVIDMAELEKTNGNTEYPGHEPATRARMDGSKVPNARASAMAAATIRGLQEIANAQRAAAASALADSIPPSQNSSSHANDVVSKVAQNFGEMMIDSARRGSVGPRQESPAKRLDTDLRHRIHQNHPSQGSINFGSYHDSSHSSPAPHASHPGQPFGPYPPPPQSMHPAMNSFPAFPPGLGFSPQPTPQMMHSPRLNNFARHHNPQSFGPSPSGTPGMEEENHFQHSRNSQSFHTQTPPLRAQHPFHSAFAHSPSPGPMHSGHAPAENSLHRSQGSESYTVGASYTGSPLQPGDAGDDLDGLLSYIHLQFNNATNADHHFQVNFAPKDGKQLLPLVLVGHSLLFSRSALLRQLMATDSSIIVDSGAPRRLITLNLNDRFARPDSVWIALQRLYGGSLLTVNSLPNSSQSRASDSGSTLETEKFDLALGYAIIGQILQMPPVEQRGMEVACHFLHWSVLLKALDFAEGYIDYELAHMNHGGAGIQRKYGRASDMLLHETLTYIIMNFPADFKLNTTVVDPEQLRRLPASSTPHSNKHHPKLSGMKFGDFRFDDDATGAEQGPASATDPHTILSAILLNFPFPLLKYVLESPSLGHNTEEIGSGQRLHLTSEVVRERERRRVQAANGVVLTASGGESQQEKALGWMESVGHRGIMPRLVREKLQMPFGHELPASVRVEFPRPAQGHVSI